MDYLADRYPGRRWWTNVRVGPIDPHVPRPDLSEAQRKLMGAFRRYADAVVLDGDTLVIVETTIFKAVEKIGPLLEYARLLPQTPEFAEWRGLPIRAELVSPIPDQRAAELAGQVGITFVTWEPPWLDEVLEQYGRRFRRAPLSDIKPKFIE